MLPFMETVDGLAGSDKNYSIFSHVGHCCCPIAYAWGGFGKKRLGSCVPTIDTEIIIGFFLNGIQPERFLPDTPRNEGMAIVANSFSPTVFFRRIK